MAWNSAKQRANFTSLDRIAMRSLFTFAIFVSILLAMVNCGKKEENKIASNSQDTLPLIKKVEDSNPSGIISPRNTSSSVKPLDFKSIVQIFPQKIGNLVLQKTNKGQIINHGIKYNSVSAEYISNNGLMIIYCYDYLNANNLPDYLRNLISSPIDENVFQIANGKGKLLHDQLTGSDKCDVVYSNRFHIKIEVINYPNFYREVSNIINNLNLSKLDESSK